MKLKRIVVFCVSAVIASALKFPDDDITCNCVPLKDCEVLSSNLQAITNLTFEEQFAFIEYLKSFTCAYVYFMPLVCCPFGSPDIYQSDWLTQLQNEHSNFAKCGRSINRDYRNLGDRAELSDFPWLALLEYDTPTGKKFLCGGALINDRYVLTAAHCVTSLSNKLASVQLGEYDISTDPDCIFEGNPEETITCIDSVIKIGIEKTIVHQGYNDGVSHREDSLTVDDIALVKLERKVHFSFYVQPICLPRKPAMKQRYIVAGWSRSFIPNSAGHSEKLVSTLTETEREKCLDNVLLPFLGKEHICAGSSAPIERACVADSGGPLMGYEMTDDGHYRLTVIGVSHMDLACDRSDLPGVYTRVFDYVTWINEHIAD